MKKILSLKLILLLFISSANADVVQKQAVDFAEVKSVIEKVKNPSEILLIFDFEDTTVRTACDVEKPTGENCSYLGSKAWFDWQLNLLNKEPDSKYVAAKDTDELVEIYNVLLEQKTLSYTEELVPALISEFADKGLEMMFVTHFNSLYRFVESKSTEMFLNEKKQKRLSDILAYHSPKLDEPLTALAACNSTEEAKVNYQNGVLYTAAQNKPHAIGCFVEQYNAQLAELAKEDESIVEKRKVISIDDNYDHVSELYEVYRGNKDYFVFSLHYLTPQTLWEPLLADGKEAELQEQAHKKWLETKAEVLKKVYFSKQ